MNQVADWMTEFEGAFLKRAWLQALREMMAEGADADVIVVIRGERGTGKDRMARVIHAASPRREQPFIKVSCASTSPDRLEAELFGHEKEAGPSPRRRRLGLVEFASAGTLFLDEIDNLPRALHGRLLQLLQAHEFSRIGGREPIRVDARLIASTTQGLAGGAGGGRFVDQPDRLRVVDIRIPALRERKEEIPLLAAGFLERFNRLYHRDVALSAETLALFMEHSWPTNVRELEGAVRELVVTGDARPVHERIRAHLRLTASCRDTEQSA
jgi:DNA-binding NtrC family response regulator